MIKAAVVGTGMMGSLHARVYNEIGVLGAVCDTDENRTRELARKYGVNGYTDLQALLDSESDILAVSVATPTPSHGAVSLACLNAGRHVLLEKPMAPTIEEASKIELAARETGLVLAVGYIEAFNPAFRRVAADISEGQYGQVTSVSARRIGGIPRSADDIILDLMTHDFGLLMELLGLPDGIEVVQRRSADGIVDSAQALLMFEHTSATCEANWISPVKVRKLAITGTSGYCEIDLISREIRRFTRPNCFSAETFPQEPLRLELEEFLSVIAGDDEGKIVSGQRGIEILGITQRARHTARTL